MLWKFIISWHTQRRKVSRSKLRPPSWSCTELLKSIVDFFNTCYLWLNDVCSNRSLRKSTRKHVHQMLFDVGYLHFGRGWNEWTVLVLNVFNVFLHFLKMVNDYYLLEIKFFFVIWHKNSMLTHRKGTFVFILLCNLRILWILLIRLFSSNFLAIRIQETFVKRKVL